MKQNYKSRTLRVALSNRKTGPRTRFFFMVENWCSGILYNALVNSKNVLTQYIAF